MTHSSITYTEFSVVFPLQQWSRERATMLRYTYTVYFSVQSNLGSRTPRIMNNSVYEQIFRTQRVSDDVLCLELRTRKPSKRRQKEIKLDNFLVRQRPSGSEAESSGAKRQKKEKEYPSKQ